MKLNFVYYYSRINIHIFVRESLCNAAAENLHLPLALAGMRQCTYGFQRSHIHTIQQTCHSTYNETPFQWKMYYFSIYLTKLLC